MWQGNSAMEAVRVPKCAMTCESTTYQIGQVEDELMVFYGFLWFVNFDVGQKCAFVRFSFHVCSTFLPTSE
jgi:hypothetical protein